MHMNARLPDDLTEAREAAVAYAHGTGLLPAEIRLLQEWLEGDGWDDLISDLDGEMALKIDDLASRMFGDCALRAELGLGRNARLNDEQRVQYARRKMGETVSGRDDYLCPSVHAYPLSAADGRTAVVGCTIEVHGQAGPVVDWVGVFPNKSTFLDTLMRSGSWLSSRLDAVTDAEVLARWQAKNGAR